MSRKNFTRYVSISTLHNTGNRFDVKKDAFVGFRFVKTSPLSPLTKEVPVGMCFLFGTVAMMILLTPRFVCIVQHLAPNRWTGFLATFKKKFIKNKLQVDSSLNLFGIRVSQVFYLGFKD
jgi:hypothetical protein